MVRASVLSRRSVPGDGRSAGGVASGRSAADTGNQPRHTVTPSLPFILCSCVSLQHPGHRGRRRSADTGWSTTEGARHEQTRRKPKRRRQVRRRKPAKCPQQDGEPVGRRTRQQSTAFAVTKRRSGSVDRGTASPPSWRLSPSGHHGGFDAGRAVVGASVGPWLRRSGCGDGTAEVVPLRSDVTGEDVDRRGEGRPGRQSVRA